MTDDAPYSPRDGYRQMLRPDTVSALTNWAGCCAVGGYQAFASRSQLWQLLMVAVDDPGFMRLAREHAARLEGRALDAADALTAGALLAAKELGTAWDIDFTPHTTPHGGGVT